MKIRSLPRDVMMGIPSNRSKPLHSARSPVGIDVFIRKPILVLLVILAGFPFLFGFKSRVFAADADNTAPLPGALAEEPLITVSPVGATQLNNDPLLRRWLREARTRLGAGQITEGLTFVQQILDHGDDGFVRLRTGGDFVGVRSQALKLLRELSPEGRAAYERLVGTQAKLLWERSHETGKVVFAAEVVRRYFHTAAGFSAANWLAARWLDQGEAQAAARLWERIMAEPAHWPRITELLRLRAAIAQRLSGNESRAIELLSQVGATPLRVGGKTRSVEQLVDSLALPAKGGAAASAVEWPTVAGNVRRNLVSRGSVPWLKSQWSAPLFADVSETKRIRNWLEAQDDNYPQRLSVASEPLVVRDQVVIREFAGIRAFDLRTGRPLWHYRSRVPLEELIQRLAATSSNSTDFGGVQEAFVGNSAWGTLSSDGQLVFAVDYVPIESVTDLENAFPKRNGSPAKPPAPQVTPGKKGPPGEDGSGIALRRLAADSDAELPPVLTRLIALPLSSASRDENEAAATVRPVWTLDGLTAATELAHSGSCLHFQGPPIVIDGCLYMIGELFSLAEMDIEKNNQLCLLAIDAQTGEMLWSQGLALVDQPFFRRSQLGRRNSIGAPSAADGMLVCPTDVGLVVGVDLVMGRQRWVYDYRTSRADIRRESPGEARGWDGSPAWPVIHRGRVVLLPRNSDQVHCLDLTSGRLLWKAPRGDALYVGAVTDELVLLVGDREVRAIPLSMNGQADGQPASPAWSQRLGAVTGRGVRVGEHYLVPLKSGRIACLELATGRDRGFSLRRFQDLSQDVDAAEGSAPDIVAAWPGNLIASGDMILSLGPSRLDAFPQAHAVLASLREQPQSVERRLLQVELTMLFGSQGSPISELQQLLREPLSAEQRRGAERQLRESLYLELDRDPSQTDALLTLLDPLAKTPAERARLLRRVCEVSLQSDPLRTVRAAREFASLPMDQEWDLDESGQHIVSVDTLAHGYLRQVRSRIEQAPSQADRVLDLLNTERNRLLASTDLESLRRFVRLCDEWPQATDIRFRLADLLIERGQFQEAELLLLRDRVQADPHVAAAATVRLLRLWEQLGLYGLAANLLVELDERFRDVPLPETVLPKAELRSRRPNAAESQRSHHAPRDEPNSDSTPNRHAARHAERDGYKLVARGGAATGRSFVAAFPRDTLTWQAFAQRQPPTWDVRRVVISEDRSRGGQSRLIESYDQFRRRHQLPAGMAFHLFEKEMPFGPKDVTASQIVDKESGVVVGQLADLDRVFYPSVQQNNNQLAVSHFLPLGGPARYRGVSLIEHDSQTSTWDHEFAPLRSSQEFLRVGPSGPNFCAFQSRQHLMVTDPASGRVLWRRGNLEPQTGLFAENEWGLFGDREALVLFAQDFSSYVVYETATGRELRRGRLNIDPHQNPNRRVFGRKLFYISDASSGRRLRIWDPLTDNYEFDEASSGSVLSNVTADGELLLVLRTGQSGRIRVLDVHAGLVNLDVAFPVELIGAVNPPPRAFSDHDRYYINLQRAMVESGRSTSSYFLNDSLVPKTDVQGELYAFARPAAPRPLDHADGPLGRRLWTRLLPQRSILRLEKNRLPFLIALSRLQDRQNGARTAVRVEAIDGESGNLLGVKDGVILDQFVQVQTDIAAGQVSLCGLRTQVRIEFGRDKQRLIGSADPF